MSLEIGEGLPDGWAHTTLGEISDVQGGVTKDSKNQSDDDEEFPYLRVANVQRGYLDLTEIKTIRIPAPKAEKMLLESGDVLFNEGGDADKLGRGWVWEGQIDRCSFQNHVFRARLYDNNIQPKYISMWGNSCGLEFFIRNAKQTTNLASINRSTLVQLPINLPPLAEQVRIADKLDVLLSRVEAGRERLERVPKLVKRFRQSVLSAAVSGELTREWRGGGDAAWEETTLENLALDIRYGTAQKCDYDDSGLPVLRIPNVSGGKINVRDLKYGKFETSEIEKLALKSGDILMIRSNGSADLIGLASVVDISHENYLYAGYLIRVRLKSGIDPHFIWNCLSAPELRSRIETNARSSSGVHNLNAEEIRQIEITLPPLPEQAEIVRRVEALFAIADRLEARSKAASTHYQRLTPALLAKAFRGELVEQDPNDEPASVLLERIKAQRAAAGAPAKAGGRGRRPEVPTPGAELAGEKEPQSEQRRGRGRPRKVPVEAEQTSRGIPVAASAEEAIRLLQERARAEREGKQAVQAGLFELK